MVGMLERGLIGERRALSLLVLGFYTTMFVLGALAAGGPWVRFFGALALTYGLAFFALAAEWFWGRWFAQGIGMSGVSLALIGLVNVGWEPGLLIWGGLHLAVYLPLFGEGMARRYEGRDDWRQRWGLDAHGVERLKRAVSSAATGLPTLIIFALAPRQEGALQFALPLLVGLGLFGLLRMRFWGVALLGLGALGTAAATLLGNVSAPCALASGSTSALLLPSAGLLATLFLCLAVAPFVLPAYRFLRR